MIVFCFFLFQHDVPVFYFEDSVYAFLSIHLMFFSVFVLIYFTVLLIKVYADVSDIADALYNTVYLLIKINAPGLVAILASSF